MRWAVLCLCVAAAAAGVSYRDMTEEWNAFKLQHNKNYESAEEDRKRMKVYAENKLKVAQHNERHEQGLTSYKLGLNHFSDLFHWEIRRMNGYRRIDSHARRVSSRRPTFKSDPAPLPDYINWTEQGAVTPVKDQESCGACWAFSATGALEGQHFIKTGELVVLSEQELVDCASSFGNNGCCGGDPTQAFGYIARNNGIDTNESYPFEATGGECRKDYGEIGAADYGFIELPADADEDVLRRAVAEIGPISAALDGPAIISYESGVFDFEDCTAEANHAVLVVGYGTDEEDGRDYWLIKNSWSTKWGLDGYIKVARNGTSLCGIAEPSYPIVL